MRSKQYFTSIKNNPHEISTDPKSQREIVDGIGAVGCFLYHKVTKLKANHNRSTVIIFVFVAVSYITKLLN